MHEQTAWDLSYLSAAIRWIVTYPADNVIHPLNNKGLLCVNSSVVAMETNVYIVYMMTLFILLFT